MGGTKIGTYKYMAPEVYNNRPCGTGADICSLGLVMYWLLNERRMPFLPLPPARLTAGMEEQARSRRFSGEPFAPPAHGSIGLKQIVMNACAYDPKERFTSATEMLNALRQLRGGVVAPPSPPTPKICIRFLNTDGSVIQARNYLSGEQIITPAMAQEFECEGVQYGYVGWSPDVPKLAGMSMDCQVVYKRGENPATPPVKADTPMQEEPPVPSPKHRLSVLWMIPLGILVMIPIIWSVASDVQKNYTGWATFLDGEKYYFKNGVAYTGWKFSNGLQYFEDGAAYTGRKTTDGKEYYFKDGVCRS